jgi:hypothetical protein
VSRKTVHSPRPPPKQAAAAHVAKERRVTGARVPHIGNSVAGDAPAQDRVPARRRRGSKR